MTQQTQKDLGVISPSLEAKLRQFAEGLTPDEQAQVRAMQTESDPDTLSPSLAAKAEQAANGLSSEDGAQLRLLVERAGMGVVASEDPDTRGQMIAQDRVRPGPEGSGGGFGFGPFGDMSVEAKWIAIGVGVIAGIFGGSPAPEPGQP